MAQYQVTFHVEVSSEQEAQEWKDRANKILTFNQEHLLVDSQGKGSWCPGHVFPPENASGPSAVDGPPKVLGIGSRS